MMFDTLVSGEMDEGEEEEEDYLLKNMNNNSSSPDTLLHYLQTHNHMFKLGQESSATDPDLSWDEGDLPSKRCIQVWSMNDFMDQYNQLYSWLNNIQVQYHAGKKKEGNSPRVEGLLRDLEKDVQKRERFLRECGRMVGQCPEVEEEVVWRVDHVISKWNMLISLRNRTKNNQSDLPDIYADIELEVRFLRKWLKEMEQRIDPLQFNMAAGWNTRDRELKMAEYQVLQTDIESHGRIVKLVLGLCEDLSLSPGLYDLPHALKVAKSLERRWHHIWLRSLEWQCLLEQWIQDPRRDPGDHVDLVDWEEEPLTKIPRLDEINVTPNFSPAATLLRVKRRKRWMNSPPAGTETNLTPESSDQEQERRPSPRVRRRLLGDRTPSSSPDQETNMRTTETDTSSDPSPRVEEVQHSLNSVLQRLEEVEAREMEKMKAGVVGPLTYWDTSDEEAINGANPPRTVSEPNLREMSILRKNCAQPLVTSTPKSGDQTLNSPCGEQTFSGNQEVFSPSGEQTFSGNLEVFSLDSLEIPDLDSFLSTQLILTGSENDSLNDVSSREFYRSSNSSQGVSLESLVSEESLLPYDLSPQLSSPLDRLALSPHLYSSGDLKVKPEVTRSQGEYRRGRGQGEHRRGRRKTRKRSIAYCVDDSQSDVEIETVCSTLQESSRNLQLINNNPIQLQQYDGAMNLCSENINLLFNLNQSFKQQNSFINKKTSRETRLLLGKWEQMLESLSQQKILQQNLQKIRDKAMTLRSTMLRLKGETRQEVAGHHNTQDILGNKEVNGNLQQINTKLSKYKENLASLEVLREDISDLNLNLHTLKAQAGARQSLSPHQDRVSFFADTQAPRQNRVPFTDEAAGDYKTEDLLHNDKIPQIQENVTDLYCMWEDCHYATSSAISAAEETQAKLELFAAELSSLKDSLRRDAQRRRGYRREGSSDSGISDGSSEPEFGLWEEQLERLRQLGSQLEGRLDSGSRDLISRTLETTSFQLRDLHISNSKSKLKVGCRRPLNQTKRQPKFAASRRRRVFKMAAVVHVVMVLLMLVSWLTQPRCCDNIGSMSLVPQLKYINGPPPI